jgi:hypothetical protein
MLLVALQILTISAEELGRPHLLRDQKVAMSKALNAAIPRYAPKGLKELFKGERHELVRVHELVLNVGCSWLSAACWHCCSRYWFPSRPTNLGRGTR